MMPAGKGDRMYPDLYNVPGMENDIEGYIVDDEGKVGNNYPAPSAPQLEDEAIVAFSQVGMNEAEQELKNEEKSGIDEHVHENQAVNQQNVSKLNEAYWMRGDRVKSLEDGFDPAPISERISAPINRWLVKKSVIVECLVNELCVLSEAQRLAVAYTYCKKHETKDLKKVIRENTSGPLQNLLLALVSPRHELTVSVLKFALRKKLTILLLNILCTLSAEQLQETHMAFNTLYPNTPLAKSVLNQSGGWLHKRTIYGFFRNLLENGRTSDFVSINENLVRQDVRALINALRVDQRNRVGINKATFVEIFSLRSFRHLALVATEFERMCNGKTLMQTINDSFAKHSETGYACSTTLFYATRRKDLFVGFLKQATASPGKNYRMLIRVVIARGDIDLIDVLQAYGFDLFHNWAKQEFKSRNHIFGNAILKLCGYR